MYMFVEKEYELKTFFRHIEETAVKSAELESENQQQKMMQSKPILLLLCFEFIVETVCLNERHTW